MTRIVFLKEGRKTRRIVLWTAYGVINSKLDTKNFKKTKIAYPCITFFGTMFVERIRGFFIDSDGLYAAPIEFSHEDPAPITKVARLSGDNTRIYALITNNMTMLSKSEDRKYRKSVPKLKDADEFS